MNQSLIVETVDARYQAVVARDAKASFFYGVSTTGVYCRPSCGARTPRPENVSFHESPQAAERAGFRPCKRCKPREQPGAMVASLCRFIAEAESEPTLETLGAHVGLSPFHVQRLFKATTGLSPRQWAAAHRAETMREALKRGGRITDAIYDAGFGSAGRFYSESVLGMTPKTFRDGGKNEKIRFAVGECSLGAILVASSARGVCAILLGDDADALARELQERFPHASLIGGDKAFEALVAQVVGFVETPRSEWKLPVELRGTAFQKRVWQALRKIPAGKTVTYSELAERIGAPKAVRAVAGACAANVLAVAIPCHRVVRKTGDLSGYRWGVDRKHALLLREGAR
jgi:AraC family transcriptional regulator of adaptative response/methylated-DNA-[protein]-cysteine methyltransferase